MVEKWNIGSVFHRVEKYCLISETSNTGQDEASRVEIKTAKYDLFCAMQVMAVDPDISPADPLHFQPDMFIFVPHERAKRKNTRSQRAGKRNQ